MDTGAANIPEKAAAQRASTAFCVTMYNEPSSFLKKTLLSIAQAVAACGSAEGPDAYAICIILDGKERVCATVLDMLASLNLVPHDGGWRHDETDFFTSSPRLTKLFTDFGIAPPVIEESGDRIRIVVALKDANRGKLHSHIVFFGHLCPLLAPTYCFQVDVGSILPTAALSGLLAEMERMPRTGAVAPRIATPRPAPGDNFLIGWQNFDFCARTSVLWRVEACTGYLSVLPGQASIYRWRALQGMDHEGGQSARSPIQIYLRSGKSPSIFSRVMYMAEDRVLGGEIASGSDGRIGTAYAPDIEIATDPCDSFQELARQRRRWNNGAMACRAWVLGRFAALMARSSLGVAARLRLAATIAAQTALFLSDAFPLARLAAWISVLIGISRHASTPLEETLDTAFWGVSAACLLAHLLAAGSRRMPPALPRILGAAGCALMATSLAAGLPFPVLAFLSLPLLLSEGTMALDGKIGMEDLLRRPRIHYLKGVLECGLFLYSSRHALDLSWGTKGLTQPPPLRGSRFSMKMWQAGTCLAWIAANLVVAGLAVEQPGALFAPLNPIVEFFRSIETVIAGTALLSLIARRLSPREPSNRAARTAGRATLLAVPASDPQATVASYETPSR
jgi:chitin synthase